jgi:pyruvate,orthophosphate dikinase
MPEIVEMQVRAIFEAAADCTLRGIVVKPEVMIPLTGTVKELEWIQPRLERIAKAVMGEKKVKFEYKFGTMIEIPARQSLRRRRHATPSSSPSARTT